MPKTDSKLDDIEKTVESKSADLKNSIELINLSNIVEKMVEINAILRIEKIFEQKIVGKNPVVNVIVNDGTAKGLLSLWTEEIKFLEGIFEGDAILIENANAPKKFKDRIHLSLSKNGKVSKIESNLPKLEEMLENSNTKRSDFSRKLISELKEGIGAEIRGLIVSIHSKNPYFPVCGICNKKMTLKKGYAICGCGNKVDEEDDNLKWLFLCNCTVDDGTKTIRATLNNNTKCIDFKKIKKMIIDDEDIILELNRQLLGLDINISGITFYDEYLKDISFRSNFWNKTDPNTEFELLNLN
ncbi:conserved hypothetical protein [Methanococcus vannielii SB]|jgi:hypothetical protein|uniref:Nucleic acid binding OB-fold tRNA/helicase-type n=1 Tax=Methanococcus vannielii (strain ATCC 35089 / DSM 1224 / JCM 13029 / OCM 148 / SB) TaxID=406327 RepID=A6URA5_METVS|nr:hypothetical protein [Methanococcus vannielii]ABR55027.1 conserved hypothetical protein [Methanococcus vannielii SB]